MSPLERKGLLVARGVKMQDIAREVGCSKARVSEVVHGRLRFETPTTRKIKALIAARVGQDVATLWPLAAGEAA